MFTVSARKTSDGPAMQFYHMYDVCAAVRFRDVTHDVHYRALLTLPGLIYLRTFFCVTIY